MAIEAGILNGTAVDARPLKSDRGFRTIALIWRRSSPREEEFQLLADSLREIVRELIPGLGANGRAERPGFGHRGASG
jgi:LysR family hydrogen peroxide-inducible transcriptional activator